MATIDTRKFEDVRHFVRARLLSSEFHDLEKIVKEHVAADVWKTYYLALPAPNGFAPWDITYSLMQEWPSVTLDDLSTASAKNEAGTQTLILLLSDLHLRRSIICFISESSFDSLFLSKSRRHCLRSRFCSTHLFRIQACGFRFVLLNMNLRFTFHLETYTASCMAVSE